MLEIISRIRSGFLLVLICFALKPSPEIVLVVIVNRYRYYRYLYNSIMVVYMLCNLHTLYTLSRSSRISRSGSVLASSCVKPSHSVQFDR